MLAEMTLVELPDAVRARAAQVKALLLDVDGVLTDGALVYDERGESVKSFDVKDGLGIRLLGLEGVAVGVVSAKRSAPLLRRLESLDVRHALLGREDKGAAVRELARELGLELEQMAFVGDDLLDLPAMRAVGLPISVADGHALVRVEAAWVTRARGGRGAVREVADGLLAARGRLLASCEALLTRGRKAS